MDIKKFLVGTLVGGVAFFFLGYLIYGLALAGFFASHTVASAAGMRTMEGIVWWALIIGNLSSGALLSYIFLKWARISSFSTGATAAAMIGFFISLSMDLVRFGTQGLFDLTATLTDVAVGTVMTAIAGGLVGAAVGIGNKG